MEETTYSHIVEIKDFDRCFKSHHCYLYLKSQHKKRRYLSYVFVWYISY